MDKFNRDQVLSWKRCEHSDGQLFDVEHTTAAHDKIVTNLVAQLELALRGGHSHVYTGNLVVVPNGMVSRPDIAVTCLEPEFLDREVCAGLTNPALLLDVLAESPGSYDYGDKFRFYRGLPSLHEYVLISPWKRDIEYCYRLTEDIWVFKDVTSALQLERLGIEIPLEHIYRDVQLARRTPQNPYFTAAP